jgi:hypothetical protein
MGGKATVAPITSADLEDVGAFMSARLNPKVPPSAWAGALEVPWPVEAPNHGYHLRDRAGDVVGAYLAYYSRREVAGELVDVCNLGAWCVAEEHRFAGVRLLTTLLAQPGYHFTDLSPSGNVVPLNRKMRFVELDTTADLVPHVPRRCRCRVSFSPERLHGVLAGRDRELWHDHRRAAAARHAVISTDTGQCYVMFRKDTRRGVRAFASVLHVGDPEVFREHARCLGRGLLRQGCVATLVERRLSGGTPRGGRPLQQNRPKMFRSATWTPTDVDYLYSELTCLEW